VTIHEIIFALFDWGHFRNPANRSNGASWNVQREDVEFLEIHHPAVREAIASYQHFMVSTLDLLSFNIHERPSIADGHIGPATEILFDVKRCACPDYAVETEQEFFAATGTGSWPAGCYPNEWPNSHAIKIRFDKSGMRPFLSAVFDSQVWPTVQRVYADIGLMLIREDENTKAHLQASFVKPDDNWIGLAIVPGSTSCSLSIWQRYDRNYQPRNLVPNWVSLLKHEIGHNLNLNHTSGGVMNPGIIDNLPAQWFGVGDPSEPVLRRFFGGEPVGPPPDPGPRVWTHQGFWDENTGESLKITLRPPLPR
jgi:hypothetical protein